MATKREKDYDDDDDDDRLSELSDELIQKIMSLLSHFESAKLGNLSKRLSSVWLSSTEPHRLCLLEDSSLLIRHNLETLTISDDLRQFSRWNSRPFPVSVFSSRWITSLSLQYLRFSDGELLVVDSPLLRKFQLRCCSGLVGVRLSGAVKRVSVVRCDGLKSLHLDVGGDLQKLSYSNDQTYDPCNIVFNAASHKSLKALKLEYSTGVTDDWLRDNVSKLVSLETLELLYCTKLRSVHLDDQNSKTLKHLKFAWANEHCSLNLSVLGLESLTLEDYMYKQPQTLDFRKCIGLRRLEMVDVDHITPQMIEASLNSNPYLNDITIKNCYFSCHPMSKAARLMWGYLRISRLFTSGADVYDSRSYTRYWDFLRLFGQSKTLKFEVGNGKRFMFPKNLRETLMPPLYTVKNLELEIGSLFDISSIVELVDAFLWLSPRLSIVSLCLDNSTFMIKFYYVTEQDVFDRTRCCSNAPMTCWRHGLTEVVIEDLKDDEIKEKLHNYFVINVNAEVKLDYRP